MPIPVLKSYSVIHKKRRSILGASVATLLASLVLGSSSQVSAASAAWNAAPTDGNWVTTGAENNWSTGVGTFPGATTGPASTDVATFSGASSQTAITINSATLNIGSITFAAGAGSYTIGATNGNALLLTSGGTIQTTGTSNIETINAPLVIEGAGGTYTFTSNALAGTEVLNIGGGITGGAAGATVLTLTGANTGSNTISGVIGNGASTSLAVVKASTGTWVLSGENTYTGGTTVNGGTLQLGDGTNAASLVGMNGVNGSGGAGTVAVTVNNGATLQVMAGATITGGAGGLGSNSFNTIGGAGGTGVSLVSGGILTNSGTITGGVGGAGGNSGNNTTGGDGGTGLSVGGGSFTNNGTVRGGAGGAAGISGAGGTGISFSSGGTLINNQTITGGGGGSSAGLGGAGGTGVSFSIGGSLTNGGTITGGGGGAGGDGGMGVSFSSGGIFTNSGTVRGGAGGSASTGGDGGTGVSFSSGGSLINNGTITGGAGGTGGGAGGTGVSFGSGGSLTNSGTITAGAGGAGANGGAGGTGVSFSIGGSLTNSGTITAGGGGGQGLFAGVGGTGVTFAGAAGTLDNQNGGVIIGGVSMGNFANIVTLETGSTINGALNIGTSTAATLTLTGAGTETYSAAVTGATTFSGALTKNGAGTWIIDEVMSYTGGTMVNAGTLQLGDGTNAASLMGMNGVNGSGGAGTVAVTVNNGATLQVMAGATITGGAGGLGANNGNSTGGLGGTGVSLVSGGILTNGGTITGGVGGGNDGNDATGGAGGTGLSVGAGSFTNNGTVRGGAGGGGGSGGGGGTGISISSAGSFTNIGIVGGGAGGEGSIGGAGGTGVSFSNGGSLTNSGTITAGAGAIGSSGGAGGTGVSFSSGGSLTNSGTITAGAGGQSDIGGVGGTGVSFSSGGSLTNSGTITGGAGGAGATGGSGGTGVSFNSGGSLTNSGTIIGGGGGQGFANGAGGTGVTFAGAAGTLDNQNGGVIIGGVSMGNFANSVTLETGSAINGALNIGTSTAATLTLTGAGTETYSAAVAGATTFSGALTKNGAGTWTLDEAFNYSGSTTISAGTLKLGTPGALPSGTDVILGTASSAVAGAFDLNGNSQTVDGLSLASGNTAGAGNIISSSTGAATLTVSSTVTNSAFAGALQNGSGGLSLTKAGAGTTLTLTGTSTYTGATTVQAGTLQVDGSLGNTAVSVQNGATLGGIGSIAGAVTIMSGGILSPGDAPGTLTVGALTLNSGSITNYQLGTPGVIGSGVNDLTIVNGNLTLGGTLNITNAGSFGPGGYEIFQYSGALTNNTLAIGTVPATYTSANFIVVTGVANQVDLIVVPNGGAATTQFWDGAVTTGTGTIAGGSGTWNNFSTNFTNATGTVNSAWQNGIAVFSTPSPAQAASTVTLTGAINFSGLMFTGGAYTIVSDGVAGTSFTALGTPANSTNIASISVSTGVTATIDAAIGGSAGISKDGAGTLVLTAVETYTGGTTVNTGTLQLGDGTNAASLTGMNGGNGSGVAGADAVTVNNGATLQVMAGAAITGGAGGGGGFSGGVGGTGVSFSSGGSLINNGTITGGAGGAGFSAGAGGTGVSFSSGGSLINNGTITAGVGGTGATAGVGGTGVSFSNGGSLTNSGTITAGAGDSGAAGAAGGTGVSFSSGGSLNNSGTITAGGGGGQGGAGGTGVSFSSEGSLTNSGTITAGVGGQGILGGAGGMGVSFSSGGSLTNSGTITAGGGGSGGGVAGAGGTGVTFAGAAGTLDNQNGGVIIGGVSMGNFANSVTLETGSAINGALNIGTSTAATLTLTGAGTETYSAVVTGATTFSGALTKNGAGTWTLDEAFNYSGSTTISAGTLKLGTPGALPSGTDVILGTASSAVAGAFDLNGNSQTVDGLSLASGNTAGAGNIISSSTGAATLTVSSTVTNSAFAGALQNGSGGLSLTKAGAGTTLTLTGASTYTGTTTVQAGTLQVDGSLGNTAVSVQNGATLGGIGSIAGAVTIMSGGILSPGDAPGTLTVGALTLNSGSITNYQLGTPGVIGSGVNDLTIVNGALTLGGTLNITNAGSFGPGGYEIFQYSGALTNNTLAIGTVPATYTSANFIVVTGVANQVDLIVLPNGGAATTQFWDGAVTTGTGTIAGGSGTWSNFSTNFTNAAGTTNSAWENGIAVFSTPSPAQAASTVTLTGAINFSGLMFTGGAYTIVSDGVAGTSFTALGTPVNSTNIASISVSTGVTATIDAAIGGSAGISKDGAGTLVLTAVETYTGGTTVNTGTLQLGDGTNAASLTGMNGGNGSGVAGADAVTVNNSATLEVMANATITGGAGGVGANSGKTTGGPGGMGVSFLSGGILTNGGTITGGAGGEGGNNGVGTPGGSGGTGLSFSGSSLINNQTITGGAGGVGAAGGAGGTGVSFNSGGSFTNNGTITGGGGSVGGTFGGAGGTAVIFSSGGSLTNSGTITGGGGGSGTFGGAGGTGVSFSSGGSLTNSGIITGGGSGAGVTFAGAAGTLVNLNGGVINDGVSMGNFANSVTLNIGSTINGGLDIGTSASATLTLTDGGSGGTQTYSQAVTGANATTFNGSLIKTGTGTWILDQPFTYGGGTAINGGALVVNNTTGSGTGSGPVAVNAGGTLGGSGTISGPVTLNTGGVIAPGAVAPGTTLHAASLTWNGGGTLSLQLGAANDLLSLTGALTKSTVTAGAYTLDIINSGGLSSQSTYTLVDFGSTTFAASDFTLALPAGYSGTLVETATALDIELTFNTSGLLIQNVGGPMTPVTANFTVTGAGMTGAPGASNTINSLIMPDGSSLLIFNTLTITSGNVTQTGGSATITGGTLYGPNGLQFDVLGNLFLEGIVSGNSTLTGGGELYLDGSLLGNLQILQGILGGNGSISGNLINAGTVSPGHSPGTLTVGGNYTQTSSGLLKIEIGGSNAGQFDLLKVGGQASLNGALQLVQLNNFSLTRGDKITFLTAGQGIAGSFASVSNPFTSNTILQPAVVYGPNTVSLEAVQGSFETLAKNSRLAPNEISVARALDRTVTDSRANALINYLDAESLSKLPGDFVKIDPEQLTSMFTVSTALANVQSLNLQRRADDIRSGSSGFSAAGFAMNGSNPGYSGALDITTGVAGPAGPDGKESIEGKETKEVAPAAPIDERWGTFLSGTGEWVNVGDTPNARGYNLESGGFTLGVDYKFSEHFTAGLSFGYTGTTADLTDRGRLWVNGGKVGVYTTTYDDGWYIDTAVNGGYNSFDTRREALQGEARADADGGELNALFGTGYDFKKGALSFGPTATFNYTYAGLDSFTEHGSLAPLNIHGSDEESLRTAVGFKLSYDCKIGGLLIKPQLRAAWQHEFGDTTYTLDSSFADGAGGIFPVDGPKIGRDSALVSGGFAIQCSERTSIYLYYDGELGRTNYHSSSVSGGFRVEF